MAGLHGQSIERPGDSSIPSPGLYYWRLLLEKPGFVKNNEMTTHQEALNEYGTQAKNLLRPLLIFLATIWLIEIFDRLLFSGSLDQLGIVPRQAVGLRGVLFAPFLHAGFEHLLANSIPLLVLGFMLMLRHKPRIGLISVIIVLISGLGTWLFAPANTVTIGSSGLVFGYFGFLVVNAWYERSAGAILFATIVIIAYGGLIGGIFPAGNGISWQSHLFGLLGGVIAAYYLSTRRSSNPVQ